MMKISFVFPYIFLTAPFLHLLTGQEAAPTKADSSQVKAAIVNAEASAGMLWAIEAQFFCGAPKGNKPDDPVLDPAKLFDNLYFLGRTGTAVFAITTSAGIILIDSGYENDVEPILVNGMQELGLDPAQVKIIVITHGHPDHFGGAFYLQEHYGARVYLSQRDWDLIEHPSAARGGNTQKGRLPKLPVHDMVLTEGSPVVLGDEKIIPVAIPGHTPGSMGLIFPVKDDGNIHMAAIFGGTMLGSVRVDSIEELQDYAKSISHFKEETKEAQVDVELQNHPLYDNFPDKLKKLKERKRGDPNPFVVGRANYQRFVEVMADCLEAQIGRRKE